MPAIAFRAVRLASLWGATLLLITLLAACGKKGPVRPLLASLPAAPGELVIRQQGDGFLLAWPIPERNQDGSPADDLSRFHIYRLSYAAADGCPTCRDPEELVAVIDPRRPEPAMRAGNRLYWRDAAVAAGTGHAYLVVPATIGGHEGAAVAGHLAHTAAPPSPAGLRAEAEAGQVRLNWAAVAAPGGGQTVLGYNLYRRGPRGGYPPLPLNAAPLRDLQLIDRIAEGGKEVAYRVSSVVRSGTVDIESAPSAEVVVPATELR